MINAETLAVFRREIEKSAEERPQGFMQGLRNFTTHPVREAHEGWKATRNDHPLQQTFLKDELHGHPDEHAAAEKSGKPVVTKASKGYHADAHDAPGTRASLRRGGWLANVPEYKPSHIKPGVLGHGEHLIRKGLNTVGRHMPGNRAGAVIGTAMSLPSDLAKKDHTGRTRGIGERVGGAAASTAGNLAGMRHGLMGGMAVGMASGGVGRVLGRAGDSLASKAAQLAKKKKQQVPT